MALEKWQVNTLRLTGSVMALLLTTFCPQFSSGIAIGSQILLTPEVIKFLQPLLGMIASVSAGNVANAIEAFLPEGTVNQHVSLANEHLTRVVGRAIAAVIAEEIKQSPTNINKPQLQAMGVQAEKHWLTIIKEIIPQVDPPQTHRFRELMEQNLPDIITPTATKLTQETCLDKNSWAEICRKLNEKASSRYSIPAQTLESTARRLHTEFPKALREALKQDFVEAGEAYAGLTLSLMTEMRAKLGKLEASQQQNFTSTLERFDLIERYLRGSQSNQELIFSRLSNQIESGFTEFTELLESLKESTTRIEGNQDKILKGQQQSQQTLTQIETGQREIQKTLSADKLPPKVFNALLNFDYTDQASSFENFFHKDNCIGACLIHGEENSGQPWLLYRLLCKHPYIRADSTVKKINIMQVTQSGDLKSKICQGLNISDSSLMENVFEEIVNVLKSKSIIFVIRDVHNASNEYIEQFLRDFWQELVNFYDTNPPENKSTRLLFFLIDSQGKARNWKISCCDDINQKKWTPHKLVRLKEIKDLENEDLKYWLARFKKDLSNQLIDEENCQKVMEFNLLQSQETVNHQSVLEHICNCYNIQIGELEEKWKPYY